MQEGTASADYYDPSVTYIPLEPKPNHMNEVDPSILSKYLDPEFIDAKPDKDATDESQLEIQESEHLGIDFDVEDNGLEPTMNTTVLAPREYQFELFEKAKTDNIIVVLETGSGKTLISVLLIKEMVRREQEARLTRRKAKLAFFLVDRVPLVFQQANVIEANCDLHVEKICGEMNVDNWSEKRWKNLFLEADVCVMTAQIFLDLLRHGFLRLDEVHLLIFDECHHTTKFHPYNLIMQEFYEQCLECERPKIFGMTASPMHSKSNVTDSVRKLEKNLHATIYTAIDVESLTASVNKPKEIAVAYVPPPRYEETALTKEIRKRLGSIDRFSKCFVSTQDVLRKLGPWCCDRTWKYVLGDLDRRITIQSQNLSKDSLFDEDLALKETYELISTLHCERNPDVNDMNLFSPKISRLMLILKVVSTKIKDFCGIVFVERRHTAIAIDLLVKSLDDLNQLKSGILIGHGSTDEGDVQMKFKSQNETIRKFRAGELNLLIATSVAEEGLDIQPCNVVVRFDFFHTLIAYIQSRGRARKKDSRYFVMVEDNNGSEVNRISSFQSLEKEMKEFCQTLPHERNIANKYLLDNGYDIDEEIDSLDEQSLMEGSFRISETGATVTKQNAIPLVARYCASLPSDSFCVLKPSYEIVNVGNGYKCILRLPSNAIVHELHSSTCRSKRVAKTLVALEACDQLVKNNALDKHLMPHDYKREILGEMAPQYDENGYIIGSRRRHGLYPKRTPKFWEKEIEEEEEIVEVEDNEDLLRAQAKSTIETVGLNSIEEIDQMNDLLEGIGKVAPNEAVQPESQGSANVAQSQPKELVRVFQSQPEESAKVVQPEPNVASSQNEQTSLIDLIDFGTEICASPLIKPNVTQKNDSPVTPSTQTNAFDDLLDLMFSPKPNNVNNDIMGKLNGDMVLDDKYAVITPSRVLHNGVENNTNVFDDLLTGDKLNKSDGTISHKTPELIKGKKTDEETESKADDEQEQIEGEEELPEGPFTCWFTVIDVQLENKQLEEIPFRNLCLVSQKSFPTLPELRLFHKGEPFMVKMRNLSSQIVYDRDHIIQLSEFTVNLLRSITNKNLMCPIVDIPYFIAPLINGCEKDDYEHMSTPALEALIDWEEITRSLQYRSKPISPEEYDQLNDSIIIDGSDNQRRYFVKRIRKDMNPMSDISGDEKLRGTECKNLIDYFALKEKFEIKIPDQPLLEIYRLKKTMNYLFCKPHTEAQIKGASHTYTLPEFCEKMSISASVFQAAIMIPSIMTRVDSLLLCHESRIRYDLPINDDLFLEAYTTPSANMEMDYERLETLGDSLLKFIATIRLYINFPFSNEGELHHLRIRVICNRALYRAAKRLKFYRYVTSHAFNRRYWRPPHFTCPDDKPETVDALMHHRLSDKTLADIVEASLGAAYLSNGLEGGLHAAIQLQIPFDEMKCWDDFDSTFKETRKSMPPRAQMKALRQFNLHKIQEVAGYTFKNPLLAVEALTHASLPNSTAPCYQRLEFLGDAILDFLIIRYLYEKYPEAPPGIITDLKDSCVNNHILGIICLENHLHPHIDHYSGKLLNAIEDVLREIKSIKDSGEAVGEYWVDLNIPKVLSDVVESMLGAVFVDAGFDLSPVEDLFKKWFRPILDNHITPELIRVHPLRKFLTDLQQFGCDGFMLRNFSSGTSDNAIQKCVIFLHDQPLACGSDVNIKVARRHAATKAMVRLEDEPHLLESVCNCRLSAKKRAIALEEEEEDI